MNAQTYLRDTPLSDLLALASQYESRAAFLRSLGVNGRKNYILSKRFALAQISQTSVWPNRCAKHQEHFEFDLSSDSHAFFFGLALTDGHLRLLERNRGDLSIEINSVDESILLELKNRMAWTSTIALAVYGNSSVLTITRKQERANRIISWKRPATKPARKSR